MKLYNAILVDDHKMFAETFSEFLRKKVSTFNIIHQCNSVTVAKEKMRQLDYDFLFVDVAIPGDDTKEFMLYCQSNYPGIIIIVVSSTTDPYTIRDLFDSGINAFLSKAAGTEEIQIAVERTVAGEKYVSAALATSLATFTYAKTQHNLTKKELEVLLLVAKGLTIAEAADTLFVSQHTIIGHRRSIMQKLGVRSATEMVKYAYDHKLC